MADSKKKPDALKVKDLPAAAGSKAKDVKGGLMRAAGTSEKNDCCRTSCVHTHCNN